MAMNYHMEARRRQRFMERVCEARKRLAAGAAAPDGNDQRLQCGMINSCTSQSDPVISTDQGQFYQSRNAWTGIEGNRRTYDHSRQGPILGQTWRTLEREMSSREQSLCSSRCGVPVFKFM
ncbi:uncharacterized protein LOC131950007 isoform X4 [Physella acuta]|uniref:uncharacterized protein LOC131950007 isoform X4 n=1 Tax=Physella acuta TaxID=109671 RepID=UPI0027DBF44C|nr:uncharacterized protein LOC131950007 isoform X4 [Physella acuta]